MITRKRYIDHSVEHTRQGVFINAFDVLESKDVLFTPEEWNKVKYTELTDEQYKQKQSLIYNYWNRRCR